MSPTPYAFNYFTVICFLLQFERHKRINEKQFCVLIIEHIVGDQFSAWITHKIELLLYQGFKQINNNDKNIRLNQLLRLFQIARHLLFGSQRDTSKHQPQLCHRATLILLLLAFLSTESSPTYNKILQDKKVYTFEERFLQCLSGSYKQVFHRYKVWK